MASGWGKGGAYMGLAFVLPTSMAVCYYIGDYLHKGWGGTLGLMIGFAAGLYETMRQAEQLERRPDGDSRKPPSAPAPPTTNSPDNPPDDWPDDSPK